MAALMPSPCPRCFSDSPAALQLFSKRERRSPVVERRKEAKERGGGGVWGNMQVCVCVCRCCALQVRQCKDCQSKRPCKSQLYLPGGARPPPPTPLMHFPLLCYTCSSEVTINNLCSPPLSQRCAQNSCKPQIELFLSSLGERDGVFSRIQVMDKNNNNRCPAGA